MGTFNLDPVSILLEMLWVFPFFLVYGLSIWLKLYFGKSQGILSYFWSCRVLLSRNLASPSVCGFWVWKQIQFGKLDKESCLSIGAVAHSLLIFCLHRLKSIHGDGPPILLLGSMKHHGFIQLTHLTLLLQASTICTPIVHSHLASIILGFHHWLYQGAPFSSSRYYGPPFSVFQEI